MTHRPYSTLIIASLVVAACTTASPAPPAAQAPSDAASTQGQQLFALNCGECHGDNGLGSDGAPAVTGHTVEQVVQQVREPEGDMEAIPADKLPEADLQAIAAYVASLPGEDAHPAIQPSDEERAHLEAAFEAIEDYEAIDRPTAITHLEQAVALASGEAAELYAELLDAVKTQRAGNARHELKELLGLEEEH